MGETVLFDYWRSSASYRVRIALNLLAIPYRSVPVDLLAGEHKQPEHLARNPQGLVPRLRSMGRCSHSRWRSLNISPRRGRAPAAARRSSGPPARQGAVLRDCHGYPSGLQSRRRLPCHAAIERPGGGAIGMDAKVHRRGPGCLRTDAGQSRNRRILPWRPTNDGRSLPRTADLQCPPMGHRAFRLSAGHGDRRELRATSGICARASGSSRERSNATPR